MQEKFDQFFNANNNQSVEAEDPSNADQCMDLAFAWCDKLGIPRSTIRHLYAYQVYTNPNPDTKQYFDLIANGPTNAPVVGDFLIFGTKVGPAGHISVVRYGDANNAQSFDQNWDTLHFNHGKDPRTGLLIPYSRLVMHTGYWGVIGWLHPKMDYKQQVRDIIYSSDSDSTKVKRVQAITP